MGWGWKWGGEYVITRIDASDGLEDVCGVFDGASHGADSILMLGDGNDQVA